MPLFTSRKKSVDFQRYVRRLIDLTSPIRACSTGTERFVTRNNRVIPTLVCPWENNTPTISKVVLAVTKDLGDQGVGIISNHPLDLKDVVVGFCHEEATASEPWFFLGVRRTSIPIGGGFWLSGIELTEFMNENWSTELEPLVPMARTLLPPSVEERDTSSAS
jgi:hypothetical protein